MELQYTILKKHTELSERLCAPLGALRHVERDAGAGDETLLLVGARGEPSGAEKRGQRRQSERKRGLIDRARRGAGGRGHERRTRRCGSGSAARRRLVAARSARRQRPCGLRTRGEHLHASARVGASLAEHVQPAARHLVAHDLAARLL